MTTPTNIGRVTASEAPDRADFGTPNVGRLVASEAPDIASFTALSSVTLAVPVLSDEGAMIPAGSHGTVVGIWAGGDAFEVEFTQPFDALASVEAAQLVQPA